MSPLADEPEKLSDKGEAWLVERIIRSLPALGRPGEGPGDDAAVVYMESGPPLLLCIDTLVEGVHFRPDISSTFDVGWKAVAVNVSDIAAMGGFPTKVVISVSAPPDTSVEATAELVEGASACAGHYEAAVVGGDTCEAPQLVVTVAALGAMPPGIQPVLRSGARPGDRVLVTGRLGAAQLGLEAALSRAEIGAEIDIDSESILAHRRPLPRVREGITAARYGASSMIDISDGLVLDASRLAGASGVAIVFELEALPLVLDRNGRPGAKQNDSALNAALTGGDDYELLFTVSEGELELLFESWREQDLAPLTAIGRVEEGSGVRLEPEELVPKDLGSGGWEHFGSSMPG